MRRAAIRQSRHIWRLGFWEGDGARFVVVHGRFLYWSTSTASRVQKKIIILEKDRQTDSTTNRECLWYIHHIQLVHVLLLQGRKCVNNTTQPCLFENLIDTVESVTEFCSWCWFLASTNPGSRNIAYKRLSSVAHNNDKQHSLHCEQREIDFPSFLTVFHTRKTWVL